MEGHLGFWGVGGILGAGEQALAETYWAPSVPTAPPQSPPLKPSDPDKRVSLDTGAQRCEPRGGLTRLLGEPSPWIELAGLGEQSGGGGAVGGSLLKKPDRR